MKWALLPVAAALLLAACSSTADKPSADNGLRVDSGGFTASESHQNVPIGTPFLVRTMGLCVEPGSDPVTVDDVVPLKADGMQVIGWGLVNYGPHQHLPAYGSGPGRITDYPVFKHSIPVAATCGKGHTPVFVEVNVRPTKPVSSVIAFGIKASGFQVNIPYSVQLCAAHKCPPFPS